MSWTGGLFHRSFFFLGKNCRIPTGVPHSRTLEPWHGCPVFLYRRNMSTWHGYENIENPCRSFWGSGHSGAPAPSLARSPFLRAPGAAGRCFAPAPRFAPRGPPEWLAQTTTPGLIARAFQISSLCRDGLSPVQMIRLRRSQTKRRGAPATEASGSMSPIPLGAEWEPWDVDDLVRGGREPWVSMALHDGS